MPLKLDLTVAAIAEDRRPLPVRPGTRRAARRAESARRPRRARRVAGRRRDTRDPRRNRAQVHAAVGDRPLPVAGPGRAHGPARRVRRPVGEPLPKLRSTARSSGRSGSTAASWPRAPPEHRSPLVQLCVDDYLRGARYPLEMLSHVPLAGLLRCARWRAETMARVDRRAVGRRGLRGRRLAARRRRPACRGAVHVQLGRGRRRLLHVRGRLPGRAARLRRNSAYPLHRASFAPEYRDRVFAHFLAELAGRPDAESRRALQPRDQVRRRASSTRAGWAPSASRPGTMRASIGRPAAARRRRATRTRAISCTRSMPDSSLPASSRSAACARRRCGASPASADCPSPTSGIPPASASSASGPFGDFVGRWLPGRPGPSRRRTARWSAGTAASSATRSASAAGSASAAAGTRRTRHGSSRPRTSRAMR